MPRERSIVTSPIQKVEFAVGRGFISPVEEIVADIRNGRMVILVDAEDRENEGDLVIAAQMATPERSTSWPAMAAASSASR
jgi:3,4-dihydroxy 2-butanone 4-phosphate synthase / GTP cyclohydrolase II